MRALAASGRQTEALRAYQRYREHLGETAGVVSEPEVSFHTGVGQVLLIPVQPSGGRIRPPLPLAPLAESRHPCPPSSRTTT